MGDLTLNWDEIFISGTEGRLISLCPHSSFSKNKSLKRSKVNSWSDRLLMYRRNVIIYRSRFHSQYILARPEQIMSRTLVCTLQTMNLVLSMYTILVPIVIRLSIWKFKKKNIYILIIVEESYVFSLMAVSPGKLKTLILIYVSDLSLI